jgi:uncharacterized protein (TIGR00299 family) protein
LPFIPIQKIDKMRILHIDLHNSGISGDMFLSSLLGLVPDFNEILKELEKIIDFLPGVSKLKINLIKTEKTGILVNQLKIDIKETKSHRTADILQKSLNDFLVKSNISDSAKNYAFNVLNSLIKAETEVHEELVKNIHLHELSSVDTLIDIIGVATVLDRINGFDKNIKISCSKIPLGSGTVNTKHGILAVPAPATLKILEKSNLITYGGPIESELVTPTGAALLVNLNAETVQYLPEMKILNSIYSTGQKKFDNFLNVLRLFYGKTEGLDYFELSHPLQNYIEQVTILETDVDDVSGEVLGHFIINLEKKDILDVQIFPSITKKNRPGHIIKILCYPEQVFDLIESIVHELGTLGVRFNIINRVCVNRKIERRNIEIHEKTYEIAFKISYIESDKGLEIINIKPEYEDLKKISQDTGLTLKKIQLIINAEIKQIYDYLIQNKK